MSYPAAILNPSTSQLYYSWLVLDDGPPGQPTGEPTAVSHVSAASSPAGRIPYITHLNHYITLTQLPHLPAYNDLDSRLSPREAADSLAWSSYIHETLTDLVNHTMYSLPPNWSSLTSYHLTQGLSWPKRSYIPDRCRGVTKARLNHVGLWGLGGSNPGDSAEEDQKRFDETFIVGPGGTLAPRQWSWRSGIESEKRKKEWGEQDVGVLLQATWADG